MCGDHVCWGTGAIGQLQSAVGVQPGQWLYAGRACSSRCVTLGYPKTPPKRQEAGYTPWICFPRLGSGPGAGMNPAQWAEGCERMARAELCAAAPSGLQQCEMYQTASPFFFRALTCSQCPCPPVVLQPPGCWVTQRVQETLGLGKSGKFFALLLFSAASWSKFV